MISFTPLLTISVGPLTLATHGVAMAVGILVATWLAQRNAKRQGLSTEVVETALMVALVAGLIGARVVFVAVLGRDLTVWEMFKVWEGGLSSHGGYVSAIVAGLLYLRYKKQDILRYTDALLPYMLVGWAIGRIGCLNSIGEWGKPLIHSSPVAFLMYGVPRYPTSLFESFSHLVSFGVVWVVRRSVRLATARGFLTALTLFLFTVSRFFLDFIREYTGGYQFFSQIITSSIATYSLVWLVVIGWRALQTTHSTADKR